MEMRICNCAYEDFCDLFNGYEICLPRPCRFRKDPSNIVEVVRCKDCKHFRKHRDGDYCYVKIRLTKEDDFCPSGERKDNGTTQV